MEKFFEIPKSPEKIQSEFSKNELEAVQKQLETLVTVRGEAYHNAQIIRADLQKIIEALPVIRKRGYDVFCFFDQSGELGEVRVEAAVPGGEQIIVYRTSPNGYKPEDSQNLDRLLANGIKAAKKPAAVKQPGDVNKTFKKAA